jgi:hypothetical protein
MKEKLKAWLGNLKLSYIIYNFFHQKQLLRNKRAYKKYGVKRPAYFPISSKLLEHLPDEKAWLDASSLKSIASTNNEFKALPNRIQESIANWSEDGFAIIPSLFSNQDVDTINQEIERLVEEGTLKWLYGNKKLMFAYRHSEKIRQILNKTELTQTLNFLLGKKADLFSSINFYQGSEQLAHSDSIHMSTYPTGYLIASWIALEDIHEDSGPITYYPGSHKQPYISNEDFDHGGSYFRLGKEPYFAYEKKIAEIIDEKGWAAQTFLPQKGDILIWHANLIHGGSKMLKTDSSRKSMVLHYYAEDVICYHEITQRPTLWP